MPEQRIESILTNMAELLIKVAESTASLLEQSTGGLVLSAVSEQRNTAATLRRDASSLRESLRLIGSNQ